MFLRKCHLLQWKWMVLLNSGKWQVMNLLMCSWAFSKTSKGPSHKWWLWFDVYSRPVRSPLLGQAFVSVYGYLAPKPFPLSGGTSHQASHSMPRLPLGKQKGLRMNFFPWWVLRQSNGKWQAGQSHALDLESGDGLATKQRLLCILFLGLPYLHLSMFLLLQWSWQHISGYCPSLPPVFSPSLSSSLLGMEHRASHMLGKSFATDLHPQLLQCIN